MTLPLAQFDDLIEEPRAVMRDAAGADEIDAVNFWRTQLAGAEPLLAFPVDMPRPAHAAGHSAIETQPVSPMLADRLRQYCATASLHAEEVLLAAFQVLLFRYSHQPVIVVGVSGDDAVVVPLVQPVDASLPFSALLRANAMRRAQVAELHPRDFAAVVHRLAPAAPSHAPIFQHRFLFVPTDIAFTPAPLGPLDTSVVVIERDGRFTLHVRYDIELYETASAERWVRNFLVLLASICDAPDTPIGMLDLLHPIEHAFIKSCLDHDDRGYRPRYHNIVQAFEDQLAKTPSAIALRCGDASLSFALLDRRANAIAFHLASLGVASGDLVGLCTARTVDMIAGLLGILKLGAAYLPMDLSHPRARLAAIATESRLTWMLCDDAGCGLLQLPGLREVDLASIATTADALPPIVLDTEALCHVIFTSGSTGKPKGVMTRHRNVLAFMEWVWATFTAADLSVVLCGSSLCFDMTVFEIWGPLTTGGTVVLVDNAASLVRRPDTSLTLVTTVPTAVRLWVDEKVLPANIRVVITCGEPLDVQLVKDVFSTAPGVMFFNTYGPTEDTVFSTAYRVPGPPNIDPPIGVPIAHEFARIVDASGVSVPVGAVGELLIGGAGVAKGYLHNPEQTKDRFRKAIDAFGEPAEIYHTGDFVRLRADGQIHFVGRKDDQIKIRGFRIDLGDVVAALVLIPGVLDARVLVQGHPTGDLLVAYVSHAEMAVGVHYNTIIAARITQEALARLPAYMVPSHIVLFDRLPLNENGKVDRQKLLAVPTSAEARATHAAPMNDAEWAVAGIWQIVLNVESVGRDDDFFELGGNSLQAIRMMSRVNRSFATSLHSQAVFEDRSVARLTARLQKNVCEAQPRLERVDLSAGVAPTFPQLAMLLDPGKASFNMCSAMHVEGLLDEGALRRALLALIRRHEALGATFTFDGANVRTHFAQQVPDILQVASADSQSDAAAAVAVERRRPFALHAEPPARAILLRVAQHAHIFVLSIHHVAIDEWSIGVLKRDLAALYAAELGHADSLPALETRWGDFAHWQTLMHGTASYEQQITHWAGVFASVSADGDFPKYSCGDGPVTEFRNVVVPANYAIWMRTVAASHGCTVYVVLLAALHLALSFHSGLEQQVIWSPVARRAMPELEEAVGLYTNLTVIVARTAVDQTLRQFLGVINALVAQARVNSDVSALTAIMRNPAALPRQPMIGFNFIELPEERHWHFLGTETRPFALRIEEEADLCALELTARVNADGMTLDLAYQTSVFDGTAIDMITDTLWLVVAACRDEPDQALAALQDVGRRVPTEIG